MYWDRGFGMVGAWFGVLLGLLALTALIILVVRSFTAGHSSQHGGQSFDRSNARAILEERLVRGEITPDQYREIVRALDETPPPPPAPDA